MNQTPEKSKEQSSLGTALSDLDAVSPDGGEGRRDWRDTKIFQTMKNGLDASWRFAKHPITLSTISFGLGLTLAHGLRMENPVLMKLLEQVNGEIAVTQNGKTALEVLQTFATMPQFTNTLGTNAEDFPLINVARVFASVSFVGGELGLVGSGILQKLSLNKRRERITRGFEDLTKRETPRYLLIGPMALMDSIAEKALPRREKRQPFWESKLLDVMIHTEPGAPETLRRQIERHFDLSDFTNESAIVDWLSNSANIKRTGIDRAESGVFIAFSADNALYYGRKSGTIFTDSVLTTLVSSLGSGNADGGKTGERHFLVVLPKGSSYLAGTVEGTHLLGAKRPPELTRDLPYLTELENRGNKIDVVTPEDIFFVKHIQPQLNKSGENEVHITLHGGQDVEMLKNFKSDLEHRSRKETFEKKIIVTIVCDTVLGNIVGEEVKRMPNDQKRSKIQKIYKQSDLLYIYGDTDVQTTTLAGAAYMLGADVNKTTYILERHGAKADKTASPLTSACVYDDLVDVANQWIHQTEAFSSYNLTLR